MALIKCPECGGSVSDRASACIHCGYPLSNTEINRVTDKNICMVDGVCYDFSETMQILNSFHKQHRQPSTNDIAEIQRYIRFKIMQSLNLNDRAATVLANIIVSSGSIPQSFDSAKYPDKPKPMRPSITCPRCGSAAVTTGARGVNWTMGLIGASKTVNRCGKCGHAWTPGKRG